MDETRSVQEEESEYLSDEDNNSTHPPSERNGAVAGGEGGVAADSGSLLLQGVKSQRKRVFLHRCPFTHGCSHHLEDENSRLGHLPLNVPVHSSTEWFDNQSAKIENLCHEAASDSVGYVQYVNNVSLSDTFHSGEFGDVRNSVYPPEQRFYIERGITRGIVLRKGSSEGVRTNPIQSNFQGADSSSSSCSRDFVNALSASPLPPPETFPEGGSSPYYPPVPAIVSNSSQICRIKDTANLLASLDAPGSLKPLTHQFSPLPPSSPPSGEAATITSGFDSKGLDQGSPSGRPAEVVTPLFRHYCRRFFLETLCPGVTDNEARQVATAVECLEDRVYLYNAKSKIDYCYQLAIKLCCIQEELHQISKGSHQRISILGDKGEGGPS